MHVFYVMCVILNVFAADKPSNKRMCTAVTFMYVMFELSAAFRILELHDQACNTGRKDGRSAIRSAIAVERPPNKIFITTTSRNARRTKGDRSGTEATILPRHRILSRHQRIDYLIECRLDVWTGETEDRRADLRIHVSSPR